MHLDGKQDFGASFAASTETAHSDRHLSGEMGDRIEDIISRRRARAKFFPNYLFADPAWEILLALTLAEQRQLRLSVSQLCDRVDVPMTTVLRWIASMTKEGFLLRRDDPTDRRRKYIELSSGARDQMIDYCSAIHAPDRLAA